MRQYHSLSRIDQSKVAAKLYVDEYINAEDAHLLYENSTTAALRSFRLAFSHHDVNELLRVALTYRGLAPEWSAAVNLVAPETGLIMKDNCASALAKIYKEHASRMGVTRHLVFPETTSTLSPRNWARYAVGPEQTWLRDQGWVVAWQADGFNE